MPVVKLGLSMLAFNAIWFPTVVAKDGSLFMEALISWSVFKSDGLVPTSELMARSTYCVFAICALFEIALAVGTCGMPVKIGLSTGAFVWTKLWRLEIFASSVACLLVTVARFVCRLEMFASSIPRLVCMDTMFASSVTCLLVTVARFVCRLEMFASSVTCLLVTVERFVCRLEIFASSVSCLLVTVARFVCIDAMFASSVTCLLVTVARFVCRLEMFASSVTCLFVTVVRFVLKKLIWDWASLLRLLK